MCDRQLAELWNITPTTVTYETTTVETNIENTTMSATTATHGNFHDDVIDSLKPEEKKLWHKVIEGLPNDDKCDGDANDIIKFVEHVESKREESSWNLITNNSNPEMQIFYYSMEVNSGVMRDSVWS